MSYKLNFEIRYSYDTTTTGISIPVILRLGERVVMLPAKLDTGASFCIFNRTYAETLGLVLERGLPEWLGTATGDRFLTYGHNVTLSTLDFEFDVMVYFAAEENFRRNILGRHGWLEQVRLGLIDYESALYVSQYNDG